MKRGFCLLLGLAVVAAQEQATAAPALTPATSVLRSLIAPQGRNSISGNVFGETRRPLVDVHVELLDGYGGTYSRTKTNGAGRYTFFGLPDGRYQVKVLPFGTDYIEQVQDVSLLPVSAIPGSGAESQQVDFYLRVKKGANAGPFAAPPGTVFAQEVPEAARKLYDKGVGELREKKEQEGFASLRQALEVFPNYYLALDRLGTEYAVRGNQDKRYFEAAHILLSKALEVNSNSFSSAFGLGFSQYHLGLVNQAIENLQRAVNNYNKSINGHLWLGIALKRASKLEQAEVSLKRADELSKGKEANVHWHLAGLYSDQKRYAEAAAKLEQFLKNKPDARDAEKIKQLIAQLKVKATQ